MASSGDPTHSYTGSLAHSCGDGEKQEFGMETAETEETG